MSSGLSGRGTGDGERGPALEPAAGTPPGCARRPLRSSSKRRSVRSWSASCRSTTGTCRRPRAHCRCRGAISTRRSSDTDWRAVEKEEPHEREGPQRARLGSRDARGGQAAREAAGRRADTRPRRTDGAGLATSLDRRRGGGRRRIASRRSRTGARVGHGLVLGVGMLVWPYSHACGLKLVFYLIGATTVTIAGVWSALTSWKRRLGIAHTLSIILIIWGLGLAGRQLLPRLYGKTPVPFFCPEP